MPASTASTAVGLVFLVLSFVASIVVAVVVGVNYHPRWYRMDVSVWLVPVELIMGVTILCTMVSNRCPIAGDAGMAIMLLLTMTQGLIRPGVVWYFSCIPVFVLYFFGQLCMSARNGTKRQEAQAPFRTGRIAIAICLFLAGVAVLVAQGPLWVQYTDYYRQFQGVTIMVLSVVGTLSYSSLSGSMCVPALVASALIPSAVTNLQSPRLVGSPLVYVAAILLMASIILGALQKRAVDSWEQGLLNGATNRSGNDEAHRLISNPQYGVPQYSTTAATIATVPTIHCHTPMLSNPAKAIVTGWYILLFLVHFGVGLGIIIVNVSDQHIGDVQAFSGFFQIVFWYGTNVTAVWMESELLSGCAFVMWSVGIFDSPATAPRYVMRWWFGLVVVLTDTILFFYIKNKKRGLYVQKSSVGLNLFYVIAILANTIACLVALVSFLTCCTFKFWMLFVVNGLWFLLLGPLRMVLQATYSLDYLVSISTVLILYLPSSGDYWNSHNSPTIVSYACVILIFTLCALGIPLKEFQGSEPNTNDPDKEQPPIVEQPSLATPYVTDANL